MRFEVPQFIEIEDKIFGPFTWKQFVYLAGGGGFILILFFLLPFIFFVIAAIPIALLSGALAFYPVNERPFALFLESVVKYFSNSRLYLWRHEQEAPTPNASAQAPAEYAPPARNNIAQLSRKLELDAMQPK